MPPPLGNLPREDTTDLEDRFILGPTPAMRTRTPSSSSGSPTPTTPTLKRFFRKATKDDGMDKVLETVNFQEKFSSLPEFKPISTGVSLPCSPQISTGYVKKQKLLDDDLGSDATATPRTPRTPITCSSTTYCTTPHSSQLTGTTFFGPDFNPETFKGDCESNTSSPKTPGGGASLRRTLDGRRQLVMELFHEEVMNIYLNHQVKSILNNELHNLGPFPFQSCHICFPNQTFGSIS